MAEVTGSIPVGSTRLLTHSAATTSQGSLQGSRAPSEDKVANRQASDPQRLQSNEIETLE